MIHQPLGGAKGQATDVFIHAERLIKTKKIINQILSERTGQPLEKLEKDVERDYFMSAEEAKDYGLIDAILAKRG
jgi:ATP-dependent Clp protease protease subunit